MVLQEKKENLDDIEVQYNPRKELPTSLGTIGVNKRGRGIQSRKEGGRRIAVHLERLSSCRPSSGRAGTLLLPLFFVSGKATSQNATRSSLGEPAND